MIDYLCITVDGLHGGMIGAYGNGWIQTPTLDLLATESAVFDRYYADSLDIATIFDSLWGELPVEFRAKGYRTVLLTDDTDVSHHASATGFSEVHRLETANREKPADSVEQTLLFEAFATVVDLLESNRTAPYFFWLHLRGFHGPWDFPVVERAKYQAEDDPEPYSGAVPPAVDGEIDPDVLQSVMEGYGGGVSILDAALGGLLDSLQEGELGSNTLLLFGSTRGFALGEHRRIGDDKRLYGENLHLPLMIRFPNGFGAAVRSPMLFQPVDLKNFLAHPSNLQALIAKEAETFRESLTIHGEHGETAFVTPEWFLRRVPSIDERGKTVHTELYVKPDDRWEVNDVADRCGEMLEEGTILAALLRPEKQDGETAQKRNRKEPNDDLE